jgi:hypothetical protein
MGGDAATGVFAAGPQPARNIKPMLDASAERAGFIAANDEAA